MGLGGISIWQLLIVLAIVVLIFGTKRLKGLGGDVGGAIKSFKSAMNEEEKAEKADETKGLEEQSKDAQFSETAASEAKQESDKTR
ncbi:preprotein translocase subunit TatA [Saccharospirillum sp. MSK14-1]|uniref:twin-arginine translocase TatA/TatE family subunit n=1 Tax=Saccharospirillum sp. MSK14-1 TaxID=1897632 RepID=UPI000D34F64B|nr:twin-arginine translocase TatA/TatE family subunit [Saccharospirillum sp. MSK14-1]PTY37514.1 preprotein translocase subunit TatA [Saccharospirillum sp. MSK14-1]